MADVVEEVKRRGYDANRRRARSAETRQRIIDAARSLMLTDGYRATSVAGIAAQRRSQR